MNMIQRESGLLVPKKEHIWTQTRTQEFPKPHLWLPNKTGIQIEREMPKRNEWFEKGMPVEKRQAAYSYISRVDAGSVAGNGFTSGAIDTTGANLLVVFGGWYDAATSALALTDSKSNTWTALTKYRDGNSIACQWFYCFGGTVGTNHTFTLTGSLQYASLCASAWAGAAASPFDQENGHAGNGGADQTSDSTGSVTPGEDNELVISGVTIGPAGATGDGFAVDYSELWLESIDYSAGAHLGLAVAPIIQTTATPVNAGWSWNGLSDPACAIATFRAAAGGTIVPVIYNQQRLMGAS